MADFLIPLEAHHANTEEHKDESDSDSQGYESGSDSQSNELNTNSQLESVNETQPYVGEDETDHPRDVQGGEDVVGSRLQDYVDMPPQSPIQHSRTQNDRTLPSNFKFNIFFLFFIFYLCDFKSTLILKKIEFSNPYIFVT